MLIGMAGLLSLHCIIDALSMQVRQQPPMLPGHMYLQMSCRLHGVASISGSEDLQHSHTYVYILQITSRLDSNAVLILYCISAVACWQLYMVLVTSGSCSLQMYL